jgi:hypothetical protein
MNARHIAEPVVFRHYVPAPPLCDSVAAFFYWRPTLRGRTRERILPSAQVDLVIDLTSGHTSQSRIYGPKNSAIVADLSAPDELLGVQFRIGGASPFLRIPCGELQNVDMTLADLVGEAMAQDLLARLHEAPTPDRKFGVLEQWLLAVANRPFALHPAVARGAAVSRYTGAIHQR